MGTAVGGPTKTHTRGRKAKRPPECSDLADSYAREIVDGKIPANRRVQEACRRYLAMRRTPEKFGVWWDDAGAQAVRAYAEACGQAAEQEAGQPLRWMPWQCLAGMILHGARRLVDGVRLDHPYFKALLLVVAKGNGKTEWAAGLLMATLRDPARRVQAASTAPDGRLSQVVFERMKIMCRKRNEEHPDGAEWKDRGGTTLAHPGRVTHGDAEFTTLPGTDKALDGRIDRLVIADEAARMEAGVGRLITGLAKNPRSQALFITTPDPKQKNRPLWSYWEKCEQALLKGEELLPQWFALLYGLEPDDDARDPKTWIKAQPGLGVVKPPHDIEAAVRIQLESTDPQQRAEFETQTACRYAEVSNADLDHAVLQRQTKPADWERLAGAPAVLGIDLSRGGYGAQLDLTTICLMVADGQFIRARNITWWAGTDIELDRRRCGQPLPTWVASGHLRRMPGEWHDMAVVEAEIEVLCSQFDVRKIGVDPHPSQAREIKRWIDRGWPIVTVDQSIKTMAPAWKLWGDLLRSRQLTYDPDPVLAHALSCVAIITDNVGNRRPVKGRSSGNTDAIVAGNMAALLMEHHGVRDDCPLVRSKYVI